MSAHKKRKVRTDTGYISRALARGQLHEQVRTKSLFSNFCTRNPRKAHKSSKTPKIRRIKRVNTFLSESNYILYNSSKTLIYIFKYICVLLENVK